MRLVASDRVHVRVPSICAWAVIAGLLAGCSRTGGTTEVSPSENASPRTTERPSTYEATFPGPTKKGLERVPTDAGVLETHSETYAGPQGSCNVMWTDYPDAWVRRKTPRGLLLGAADGAARASRATIESKRETTFDGHAALEFVAKDPNEDAVYRSRAVLAGNRLFLLSVIGTQQGVDSAPFVAFERSFRLRPAR
ncbi:MAG: hypothetical protein KDC95_00850 [Planctomycetes bacterium]|nr:hypothetical protein [Planctomycetota bacterium]